ncbi:hypothetical protein DL93DRAFT_293656 [Clavulina sp. PMI_390]|nr:hypothetical protein DL93DRAFT_293656 [Clavulina sp. PMI_390]
MLIFEAACLDPDYNSRTKRSRRTSPGDRAKQFHDTRNAINLTCTQWRRVAICCPKLWATIIFGPSRDRHNHCSSKTIEGHFKLMADRFQGSPITSTFYDVSEQGFIDEYLSFVRQHATQHELIELDFPMLKAFGEIFQTLQLPTLRSLYIEGSYYYHNQNGPDVLDLRVMPRLDDFRIAQIVSYSGELQHTSSRFSLRLDTPSKIKTLYLAGGDIAAGEVVSILNLCPLLSSLAWIPLSKPNEDDLIALNVLPSLKQLVLAHHILLPVLSRLVAPELSSLQIYWMGVAETIPQSPVLLHRFPSIHTLGLAGAISLSKDKLIGLIREAIEGHQLESLKRLHLCFPLNSPWVQSLTGSMRKGSPVRLPTLEEVWAKYDVKPSWVNRGETLKWARQLLERRGQRHDVPPFTLHLSSPVDESGAVAIIQSWLEPSDGVRPLAEHVSVVADSPAPRSMFFPYHSNGRIHFVALSACFHTNYNTPIRIGPQ